ncbi:MULTISPECIES: exonuclease subunit SbcD [Staphylococcus]|uniref:Nuclease SbcCD subunit D n=3 Tax=Staphylococcus cohnii TaxID=29382 RepID=A0A2T4LS81_9STAP|nr:MULTISPECIES: exonuclease subunit SbcD [Staphylococcus]MBA1354430.1 exonuclease subunit SbcD [Staphylococcus cohnii]MBA1391314.1 exonuclease subunit SbcD [Staphylococcus cohnii]PTE78654.1 exonuclease sbcCD subunit D [Staphylococcus cohnii]PTF01450.1 exonuclease sbcCD subunit D [Staphylococcus cohnii]PTF35423.1 exonuclease sbcCD subunit D [Staphylococcus cohnii]
MKIVHTADWHLGRILNGKSLLEDQAHILDQFIKKMGDEKPDVIVIAGDLYDTSYPNKAAIQLLENTINTLNLEMNIPLVMISGNHDSKERLNYGSKWFEKSQLYIRTSLEDMCDPITIGNIDFYTLPFSTVNETSYFFNDKKIETHQQAVSKSIEFMTQNINPNKVNILIGHLTVQGGIRTESERALTIGTVESVTENSFQQFDAVLLGHLHHPFSIDSDFIHYSGSLLQYSFSETTQPKGYRVIEMIDHKLKSIFRPLMPLRQLEVIEGDYEDAIQEKLSIKDKNNYLHFKLKHMSHVSDPMMHLKQIYPNTLALTNSSFEFNTPLHHENIEIQKLDDTTIINKFFENVTDQSLTSIQNNKIGKVLNHLLEGDQTK